MYYWCNRLNKNQFQKPDSKFTVRSESESLTGDSDWTQKK